MRIYPKFSTTGYYVYQYIDPRTNLPFYIGKGIGKRYLAHLLETKKTLITLKNGLIYKDYTIKGLNHVYQ